jgi:hypothetical protein
MFNPAGKCPTFVVNPKIARPAAARTPQAATSPSPATSLMNAQRLSAPRRRPSVMPPYRRTGQHTWLREKGAASRDFDLG